MVYGEGTVRWSEKRQRWVGRYEKRDGRAKRVRGWVSARTEAECRAKLAKARSRSGTLPAADDRMRFDAFLQMWLREHVNTTVRARTADNYRSQVEHHIAPALGGHKLLELRAPHVLAYRNAKMAEGLSPRSVSHHLTTIRAALAQAERWGMVERNVASLVPGPHVPSGDTKPLSTAQARAFLAHVEGDAWEAIYIAALYLGMRQGEILGLRWRDVSEGSLIVRKSLVWLNGEPHLEDPKTERSHRTLTLPAVLSAALRRRDLAQKRERLASGKWSPQFDKGLDFVFTTPNGYALERTLITRAFQRHLAAAGLPKVPFHSTRHTATSWMLELGMTMREVADVLGHSKPSMTADVYSHLGTSASERAARLFDEVVG